MTSVLKEKKTQSKTPHKGKPIERKAVRSLTHTKRMGLLARGTSLVNKIKETVLLREHLKNAEYVDNNTSPSPSMLELSVVYGLIHLDAYEENLSDIETPEKKFVEKYKGKSKAELQKILKSLEEQISK